MLGGALRSEFPAAALLMPYHAVLHCAIPRAVQVWITGIAFCVACMVWQYRPVMCNTDPAYAQLYRVVTALEAHGSVTSLEHGSMLGAKRHHGVQPFGDRDIDVAVFSTNMTTVDAALRRIGQRWEINEAGFGYHLPAEGGSKTYIDLWFYERTVEGVRCVGIDNRCGEWHSRYHIHDDL